ncbi:hypothetical protein [Aquamicrobium terrae]|uniref:Uncharacterized protein n=1 Tax=Aquamicrobium terrae TaxID=1324945 RepID=A0ABV2N1C5_9HYPH
MTQFAEDRLYMALNGFTQAIGPDDAPTRLRHEALIAAEFDRCHPGDSFEDLKRRARFSKEDQGLLWDWMARAARIEASARDRKPDEPVALAA